MNPTDTARRYDRIADWYRDNLRGSSYGLAQLERAVKFTRGPGLALDVGCGSEGRFIRVLLEKGFEVEGLDAAPRMVELSQGLFPECRFHLADIAAWEFPQAYDFICAWDSTFHLPLDLQQPVLQKLCTGLRPGGILLFTCGGGHQPGEVSGTFGGEDFAYSTLGVPKNLSVLDQSGCVVKHLEYDQYPEPHVVIVAGKA